MASFVQRRPNQGKHRLGGGVMSCQGHAYSTRNASNGRKVCTKHLPKPRALYCICDIKNVWGTRSRGAAHP